jgi:DNA-directed RNA polymerase specialized sigma24 family protein
MSVPEPRTSTATIQDDRASYLLSLARRIPQGDRDAFADLYDVLSAQVLADITATGLGPQDADAVATSTFVEVWQLARFHVVNDVDVTAWLAAIVTRRCFERRYGVPTASRPGAADDRPWWVTAAEHYDRSAKVILADLLRRPAPDAGRPAAGQLGPRGLH